MGIVALIGCLQAIHIIPMYSQQFVGRVTSTISNPIFFAATLIIPFFLALDRFFQTLKTKSSFFYGGIASLCLMGIIASQTRGAFVGLFFGGLIYSTGIFFQSKNPKKNLFGFLFLIFLIVSSVSLLVIREHTAENSSLYRLTHFQDLSASSRLSYWNYSLQGFKNEPWLGVGHQNFYIVANKYYKMETFPNQMNWPDKPHNAFLEILVTGGIFVFVFYLSLFIYSIGSTIKNRELKPLLRSSALIAALIAYISQNLFSFDVTDTLFAFVLLLAFMTIHPTKKATKSSSSSPNYIIWISGIIPIIGSLFLLFPFMEEMHLAYIAEINTTTNLIPALEALEKSSRIHSAENSILLANQYKNILNAAFTLHHAPIEVIERIQKNTSKAFSDAIKQHPSNALLLIDSANSSYLYSMASNTSVPQESIDAAKHAHELVPGRIEPLLILANIYRVNNDQEEANIYAEEALKMNPEHSAYLWKLALFYARANNFDKAAPLGIQALHKGIPAFQTAKEIDWLIQYFQPKTDLESKENIQFLYELSTKIEPNNISLVLKLLDLYAETNQQEKIIEIADLLKQKNPSSTDSIDTYIKSLQKK